MELVHADSKQQDLTRYNREFEQRFYDVMLAEVKALLRNMGMHPGVDVDISMLDGRFF